MALLVGIISYLVAVFGVAQSTLEVATIGIKTDIFGVSGTNDEVILTLWFDFTMYECVVSPTSIDTEYSCDSSEITIIGSQCQSSDMKILIDNSATADGVVIANVFVTTTDNTLYGAEGFCIDNTVSKGVWVGNNVKTTETVCGADISHYSAICVDNELSRVAGSCGPGKQLIYFDINQPNSLITNALWSDGTNVAVDVTTCAPTTQAPRTQAPTTKAPTTPPPTTPAISATSTIKIASTKIVSSLIPSTTLLSLSKSTKDSNWSLNMILMFIMGMMATLLCICGIYIYYLRNKRNKKRTKFEKAKMYIGQKEIEMEIEGEKANENDCDSTVVNADNTNSVLLLDSN